MRTLIRTLPLILLTGALVSPIAAPAAERLRMATTTSTENSGLLAELNPQFESEHGVAVDVIAVGTGKALRIARNCDADIVFVHAPGAEKLFVEAGYGVDRSPVMHNDFVVLGPPTDPAGVRRAASAAEALRRIAEAEPSFVSRGDDSGTHKKEKSLWQQAGIEPEGQWYLAAGQGMGAVLKIADDKQAYTLSDRGTYVAFQGKTELAVVSEGDPALHNPYHIIAVSPQRCPNARYDLARRYIDYVTGRRGQKIIGDYRMRGQQLFYPDVITKP
ncbi:MAG: solute-binding protein [Gammaproteobacteria bacterium]|nr:solute-binding protein [Gammaproteobacteria bacterium]NIR82826.1 solute-binding protein [Gammaproteobacteria bacterium]NIR89935.1 solute-binding protein [Gammaproteobacteria bacterium]NIU03984.1 solute-binding protein [Gammaproteobacteria bacterium]NIV51304.1 solute-binding protein [Gammaproteobacteria bacterium]